MRPRPNVRTVLTPKLSSMMVQMLIHQCLPFDRSEAARKECGFFVHFPRPRPPQASSDPAPLLFPTAKSRSWLPGSVSLFAVIRAAHWLPFTSNDFFNQLPQQTSGRLAAMRVAPPLPSPWPPCNGRSVCADSFLPTGCSLSRLQPRQPLFTSSTLPLQRRFFM